MLVSAKRKKNEKKQRIMSALDLEIWIATTGDSPYIDETLKSCHRYLPDVPIKLLNYGLSQLGNIGKHITMTTVGPKYVLLLDDDDLLIQTPVTNQFSLGQLYMSCNDEGQPYEHTAGVSIDTVEEYMQIWNHLETTDFSGTVVATSDLADFFSQDIDTDSHVTDISLMRFLLDRNKGSGSEQALNLSPWVWGRCKKEPSAWKLKTIKQLEGNLKAMSILARAKVPGYSVKVQRLETIIESLRSNIYIAPFNAKNDLDYQ